MTTAQQIVIDYRGHEFALPIEISARIRTIAERTATPIGEVVSRLLREAVHLRSNIFLGAGASNQ